MRALKLTGPKNVNNKNQCKKLRLPVVQKRNTSRPKEKPKQRFQKLTIATVNFQSIKGEVADFAAFLSENSPDIILGSESWLDGTFATAEIFPSHYQVTRKDRNINGGGVLIAINDTIPRIERPDLMSDGVNKFGVNLS